MYNTDVTQQSSRDEAGGKAVRAFITGITGFAGSHLAEFLLAHTKLEVSGLVHDRTDNIAHLDGRLALFQGNLLDDAAVRKVLSDARPDYIFHLAGQAFVPSSLVCPWDTFEINVHSQLNVLEAVAHLFPQTKVLVVGSAEEYGLVRPQELPVTEDNPLRPDSPYGVSKVAQDMLGLQYFLRHKIAVIRVRPFNHIGPRQSERFVASTLARQLAEIEAGLKLPVLQVGNLDTQRDFTDVRDTVRAYYLLLERGTPGEVYNLGSGHAHGIRELLDILLSHIRVKVDVRVDETRLRPSDVPVSYCDYSRLHAVTGWRPAISFEQGLLDTLDYWRARVSQHLKI